MKLSQTARLPSDMTSAGRAIVVLGMHRSGTSAMARCLSLCGAALPNQMLQPQPDNPVGFWEPEPVVHFNDRLLDGIDSAWDDIFSFQSTSDIGRSQAGSEREAAELIRALYDEAKLIVLKEPRISILVPFWNSVLKGEGFLSQYVIMVRRPDEIAASLLLRNGTPVETGLLIWASYMTAIIRDTTNMPRVFVAYDQLLHQPDRAIDRIEEKLGLGLPRRTRAAQLELQRFLSPALRHHESNDARLPWPWAEDLYGWLISAANGSEPPEEIWQSLQTRLKELESITGTTVAYLKSTVRSLSARALDLDYSVQRLSQDQAEESARLSAAQRELEVLRTALEEAQTAAGILQSQFEADRATMIADRESAYERIAAVERAHSAVCLELEAERKLMTQSRAHGENCASMLKAIQNSTSWRMTMPLRTMLTRLRQL